MGGGGGGIPKRRTTEEESTGETNTSNTNFNIFEKEKGEERYECHKGFRNGGQRLLWKKMWVPLTKCHPLLHLKLKWQDSESKSKKKSRETDQWKESQKTQH